MIISVILKCSVEKRVSTSKADGMIPQRYIWCPHTYLIQKVTISVSKLRDEAGIVYSNHIMLHIHYI
jgi:hypothetical protein